MSRWEDLQRAIAKDMDWESARKAMRAIARVHGGEVVYVPVLPRVDRDAVREEVRAGAPVREVCERHEISASTCRRIVRGR